MSPRQAATRGDHLDVTIAALLLQPKLQHINQSLAIPARLALALPSPRCSTPLQRRTATFNNVDQQFSLQ
ncbi:hypothetical protein OPV22_014090 [Ensete ventricosum]|uniref:Uncharacterized protein n=1 Tax=Ensete ventricosum TaxID=4639 RepID=A0AAV8PJ62_ENSVE|nr:hypothetical protein OPV22_014090 [Ensete ventricosum]